MSKDWASFSEADNNGVCREAYGYFERIDAGSRPVSNNEIRNKILKVPEGDQCCPFDSHDFARIHEFADSITYRCRKCGLEFAQLHCSRAYNTAFLGSFIDNCSYKWRQDEMDISKVVNLRVTFGEYPIRNIEYDPQAGTVQYRNTINGSRDGGIRHPEGFFDPHVAQITAEQREKLFSILKNIDFSKWETTASIIHNMLTVPAGFCVHDNIRMLFENGRCFIWHGCGGSDFHKLTTVLTEICNRTDCMPPDHTQLCTEYSSPRSIKKVPGIITACCSSKVPANCSFCPECGSEIKVTNALARLDVEYDDEQTLWLCECLHANPFAFKHCTHCGKKR